MALTPLPSPASAACRFQRPRCSRRRQLGPHFLVPHAAVLYVDEVSSTVLEDIWDTLDYSPDNQE